MGAALSSTDFEIRTAFHRKKLRRHHECPNTIVIDELGVAHGRRRVDIAVVNGRIHGFEIKSASDTLERLPSQIEHFSKCMERLSVITAPKHLNDVEKLAPEWCGIVEAYKGPRGAINFHTVRRATNNPTIEFVALAHLLWRSEALEILKGQNIEQKILRGNRVRLYEVLENHLSIKELAQHIKTQFMSRENWRAHQP